MFNKILPVAARAPDGGPDGGLDGGGAERDKARMKTPFAIIGICIIG